VRSARGATDILYMASDAAQRRLAWLKIKIIQMEELCRLFHSRLKITQNIFEKRREADAQASTQYRRSRCRRL
jgi:hypothetical protein